LIDQNKISYLRLISFRLLTQIKLKKSLSSLVLGMRQNLKIKEATSLTSPGLILPEINRKYFY